jgi:hypothetical protein
MEVSRLGVIGRLSTISSRQDSKQSMKRLTLKKNSESCGRTHPQYAALFKELMACTGYSSIDLWDCFYKHLAVSIKDELVHTARPISTLEELMTGTTATQTQASLPNNQFISSSSEPIAMDIDATHTCEEFIHWMHRKCFGCGSTVHAKREGNHSCKSLRIL